MQHIRKLHRTLTSTALYLSLIYLSGCGGHFSNHSDQELRKEFRKCDFSKLSPGGAQRCLNIEKECKVRLKEKGFRC